jgi:hypothetical protein
MLPPYPAQVWLLTSDHKKVFSDTEVLKASPPAECAWSTRFANIDFALVGHRVLHQVDCPKCASCHLFMCFCFDQDLYKEAPAPQQWPCG